MFVVFLTNITTNKIIWNSLHMHRNTNIIKEIKECCNICSFDDDFSQKFDPQLLDQLNESQAVAIRAALRKAECSHGSFVEQIWGPLGTGKTTTISVMLYILLQMNRRTLTCAAANVAIVQVASCVHNLVKGPFNTTTTSGDFFYCIGEILLFGNKQRLKIGAEIEEIYPENRVKRLTERLGSLTGWKHCIRLWLTYLKIVFLNIMFLWKMNYSTKNNLQLKQFPKSFLREHNFQKMVIDEVAQLKEAESTIPLQLPGMKHGILIGDEYQLPAIYVLTLALEEVYLADSVYWDFQSTLCAVPDASFHKFFPILEILSEPYS